MRHVQRWLFLLILCAILGAAGCGRQAANPVQSGDVSGGTNQSNQSGLTPPANPPAPAAPSPVPGAKTLLNEVRFRSTATTSCFVEIKMGNDAAALTGLRLVNEKGNTFVLGAGSFPTTPGSLVTVLFDGKQGPSDFFTPAGGNLAIQDANGNQLDFVGWGSDPGAIPIGTGAWPSDLTSLALLARTPQSTSSGVVNWRLLESDSATPGLPNPNAPTQGLLPGNGDTLEVGDGTTLLGWYPVPGAARYRVQVFRGSSQLVSDVTVDAGPAAVSLPVGDYFWRVQSIAGDGSLAAFSQPNLLHIVAALDFSDSPKALQKTGLSRKVIAGVPLLLQRKDTNMLLLESNQKTGTHAWNVPHPSASLSGAGGAGEAANHDSDPADNMNCFLASLQMVNRFYGGRVSQDRIGFEVYKNRIAGRPERQLNYGDGISDYFTATDYALGGTPGTLNMRPTGSNTTGAATAAEQTTFFGFIQAEINAGRPVILIRQLGPTAYHATVVFGWEVDGSKQSLLINDPWHAVRGPVDASMFSSNCFAVGVPAKLAPRNEEATITALDSDGFCDFDKQMRFKSTSQDTDGDGIRDFLEIRRSVFDAKRGWARLWNGGGGNINDTARNLANKPGPPPELSVDSDKGGILDKNEDKNLNGELDPGETDPNDPSDDRVALFATENGGVSGNRSLVKIDTSTSPPTRTVIKSFPAGTGLRGLAKDLQGNLIVCEGSSPALTLVTQAGAATVITNALQGPNAVQVDSKGNFIVLDNKDLVIIPAGGGAPSKIATNLDKNATPFDLALDGLGNAIVCNINTQVGVGPSTDVLLRVNLATGASTTVFDFGTLPDGATHPECVGVTLDSNGDYIVMEAYTTQTVLARITPAGGRSPITTIAGESGGSVVRDSNGNFLFIDNRTGTLNQVTPAGGQSVLLTLPAGSTRFGLTR